MGHPGVTLRDLEASRDALSRNRYQPQPTERRLSCSHRVTFLTGANRDFPNWRRHPTGPERIDALCRDPASSPQFSDLFSGPTVSAWPTTLRHYGLVRVK